MANYFAVFRRQLGVPLSSKTYESAKTLPFQGTAPKSSGHLEDARVVKLEAGSVSEAQGAIKNWFGGDYTDTPVIITESQFKES